MTKNIIYDCYAYFIIDNHKVTPYPIRDAKEHLESIFGLKKGDKIYIKGLGNLSFTKRYTENYTYKKNGKDGLYQEIQLKCITVH